MKIAQMSGNENVQPLKQTSKKEQSKPDTVIAGLQKQINKIQEQIKKLSENETATPEDKMKKKKEYMSQIAELNRQITQRQIELQKEEREKKAREMQEQSEKTVPKSKREKEIEREKQEKGLISDDKMSAFVSAQVSQDTAKAVGHVKTQMEAEAHNLKGTIAAENSRGQDTSDLEVELSRVESSVAKLSGDMVKEYGKGANAMKEASKEDNKTVKADKVEEEKKEKEEAQQERQKEDSIIQKHVDIYL